MSLSLPPVLQEIADIIGLDAALKLAQAKGGQRVAIPGTVRDGHWLVGLLGREKADELSAYLTDGNRVHLDVPFGPTMNANRYRRTYELLDNGKSANEVARALGTTRRTVQRRNAKRTDESGEPHSEHDDRQADLFR